MGCTCALTRQGDAPRHRMNKGRFADLILTEVEMAYREKKRQVRLRQLIDPFVGPRGRINISFPRKMDHIW